MRYLPGVTLKLDAERCVGCGSCAEVCPHGVFALARRKARIEERNACMECGACARNCPAEAIFVRAGEGCATAVIIGAVRGAVRGEEPACDCSKGSACC